MAITTCNSSSTIVKSLQGLKFICLIITVLISSVFMTGCSSADGTDLPERDEVLQAIRDQGFVFNKFVISTAYGESQSQVIISGQLAQKTPDNTHVTDGVKLTQFREVIVENKNGAWEIISAPPIDRDQFTSRERWKN